ncbi:hypothetical protein EWO99_22845 [Salmonella enterica]|nr:hypothetical protein [Salmonella enterica]
MKWNFYFFNFWIAENIRRNSFISDFYHCIVSFTIFTNSFNYGKGNNPQTMYFFLCFFAELINAISFNCIISYYSPNIIKYIKFVIFICIKFSSDLF